MSKITTHTDFFHHVFPQWVVISNQWLSATFIRAIHASTQGTMGKKIQILGII